MCKRLFTKIGAVLLFATFFSLLQFNCSYAEERRVVRVGYESIEGYEEGLEGEHKSGFGYEYLQKISYYSGWDYEYVYGPFSELIEMLEKGEIDILGDVAYTDERARHMLYSSYAQGTEGYYIFTNLGDDRISETDIQSLNGKVIGTTLNTVQAELVKNWVKENNLSVEIKEYNGIPATLLALEEGRVDAIAMTDVASENKFEAVYHIASEPYYFAVSASRPDILEDVNSAMYKILLAEPEFNASVTQKYKTGNVVDKALNSEEKAWLESNSNTIRIGYLNNDLPYAATDSNGELIGELKILTDNLSLQYGINVVTIGYDSTDTILEAARNGEIDAWGPWCGDFYLSEQQGVMQTDALLSTTAVMVFEDGSISNKRIAISNKSIFYKDVIMDSYAVSSVVLCDDIHETLHAIRAGRADATIVPSGKIGILKQYDCFANLNCVEISKQIDVCLYVPKGNPVLMTIINKGISVSESELEGMAFVQYASYDMDKTYLDIMKDHPGVTTLIFTIIFTAIIGAVILLVYSRILRKKDAELEKALIAAESANQAKSSFFSKMSHDMRTPLNGILGIIEINKKHEDDTEYLKENRIKAETAAKHLLSLINDVLDMSKIEDGSVVVAHEGFHIIELTQEIMTIMNPVADAAGITITLNAEQWLLDNPFLFGSPLHIKKVFTNILSNCIKYNKENGSISIFADVTEKNEKSIRLRWTVEDTGIGMDEEYLKKIFDPFSQENTDSTSVYNGTGLGMSITKALVEKMDGTIDITSEKGVGTKFVIEIPFELAVEKDIPGKIVVDKVPIKGARILLVEDNELNREIAQVILEDEGAAITTAENGLEALNIFKDTAPGTFNIILMDLLMPVMGGIEATKSIRALEREDAATIPIVAMTANAFSDNVTECMEAGMNAHLSKPIEFDKMLKTIAKFL